MRGRKPHLEVIQGGIEHMPPPDWLSPDAKAEWQRVMPTLGKRKIISEADLGSLENYCMAMGTVREMERELQQHGPIMKIYKLTRDGDPVLVAQRKNPAISIQSDAMTRARLLAAELGATPVSRARPSVDSDDDTDDLFSMGF